MKKIYSIYGLITLALICGPGLANAQTDAANCAACHADKTQHWLVSPAKHATLSCATCHEGTTLIWQSGRSRKYPASTSTWRCAMGCHQDQYDTFEIVSRGMTYYGGSDDSHTPPKGWSKTSDFPYWNVLIDGHPFVLETYEDSPMAVNQIEHQETIRPGSEACMECHGTRAAFMMGIEYKDKNGVVHSIPAHKTQITLPNGTIMDVPAKEYVIKDKTHRIYDGTSYRDPVTANGARPSKSRIFRWEPKFGRIPMV